MRLERKWFNVPLNSWIIGFPLAGVAVRLCMETGAMLEAQKENLNITHSMCLTRNSEKEQPVILTACGTCLERLFYWGRDVKVAVTNPENTIQFHTLNELQPWHWSSAFAENRIENDKED